MKNKIELDALVADFTAMAAKFGFTCAPPSALLSEDDSLLFANSTIAGYKQHLVSRQLPFPGISIAQGCIRNQNLKVVRNWDHDLQYMSCFTQLGLLGCPQSLNLMLDFVARFLASLQERHQTKFLCRMSRSLSMYECVSDYWKEASIEVDGFPDSYYRWQYGLKGVRGEGITFAVYDDQRDEYRDIGNLIEICDDAGVLGYEFGFGAETLNSRLRGLGSPFESSILHDHFDVSTQPSMKRKLMDSLMVSATLCAIGVDETTAKRASILRRAMNDMFYLSRLAGIEAEVLLLAGRKYLQARDLDDVAFVELFHTFDLRIASKLGQAQSYIDYARLHEKPWAHVVEYCVGRTGIPSAYFERIFLAPLAIDDARLSAQSALRLLSPAV